MKNLKIVISLLIVSTLIFSCNVNEEIQDVSTIQVDKEDRSDEKVIDGAALVLDELSSRMSYDERVEYYANMEDELLSTLVANYSFDDSRNGCTYSLDRITCYSCTTEWAPNYPDERVYRPNEYGCGWLISFCTHYHRCH